MVHRTPRNEHAVPTNLNSCPSYLVNDSIVHIYVTSMRQTRLIAQIYPPMDDGLLCTDYEPMERSGSAIGNLNGDGLLDIVDITTFITRSTSHSVENFVVVSVLTRFSIDLNSADVQIVAKHQTKLSNRTVDEALVNRLRGGPAPSSASMTRDDGQILANQTWNAYLGRYANSHY